MSEFMQRQVTGLQNWLKVETRQGTEFVNSAELCLFVRNSEQIAQPLTEDEREEYADAIRDYCSDEPLEWENIKGYGARLTAPGYLDCTDWCVFDTEAEALQYLDENYPEGDDEDGLDESELGNE
jgi:hypothetical protein